MATCPHCLGYLSNGHSCRTDWRRLVGQGASVTCGAMLGALMHSVITGAWFPVLGAAIGGILFLALYEIVHGLLAERDLQLHSLRMRGRDPGFDPLTALTVGRTARRYQRSWRAALWPQSRKAAPPKTPALQDLLDEDARDAELDLLCATVLAQATELTGFRYRTMSEPVFLAGASRTILWDVIGPGGLIAISKDWPETVSFEEMVIALVEMCTRATSTSSARQRHV